MYPRLWASVKQARNAIAYFAVIYSNFTKVAASAFVCRRFDGVVQQQHQRRVQAIYSCIATGRRLACLLVAEAEQMLSNAEHVSVDLRRTTISPHDECRSSLGVKAPSGSFEPL